MHEHVQVVKKSTSHGEDVHRKQDFEHWASRRHASL